LANKNKSDHCNYIDRFCFRYNLLQRIRNKSQPVKHNLSRTDKSLVEKKRKRHMMPHRGKTSKTEHITCRPYGAVIFFIQSIFLQGFRRAAALDCLGCDFFCLRFDCHINKHPIYPRGIKAILCRIFFSTRLSPRYGAGLFRMRFFLFKIRLPYQQTPNLSRRDKSNFMPYLFFHKAFAALRRWIVRTRFFCLRFDCHINKHPIYPGGIKAL
jgi:hypothetical protein